MSNNNIIVHSAPKKAAAAMPVVPSIIIQPPSPPRIPPSNSNQQNPKPPNMAHPPPEGTLEDLRGKFHTLFTYASIAFFALAYSTGLFGILITGLLIWVYHRRAAQLAAKKEGDETYMSLDAEAWPYLVMWLLASGFGNIWIAKVFLWVVMVVCDELWDHYRKEGGRKRREERYLRSVAHLRVRQRAAAAAAAAA